MKKYFIGLEWIDEQTPLIHLKDYINESDEYVYIPEKFVIKQLNSKICIGTLNPYTHEYISCNNIVKKEGKQCNKCKYLFDFYKCVRCHGQDCYVKNQDVLNYCNTTHYVYIAYFPQNKIKVGTSSEIKKYIRLLEQGALYAIFIAKTPTGKIARQIEKNIIDNGIVGAVTTNYKMKNINYTNSASSIKQVLTDKYKDILKFIDEGNLKYLIEPEFNCFDDIRNVINQKTLYDDIQLNLFNETVHQSKKMIIKEELKNIYGKFLFAVGKIIAIENDEIIELIDTRKMEGGLFEFDGIKEFNYYTDSYRLRRR